MQKKNEMNIKNSRKIGIYYRLYSFILNIFFSPTLKPVTMGHVRNSDNDHQILLKDQSRNGQDSNLVASSEILVEFRHNIGSSNWKKNDEISRVEIIKPEEVHEAKAGGDFEAISLIKVKGKEPNKIVSIKEFTGRYQKDGSEEQHQQQQGDKSKLPISRNQHHSVQEHIVNIDEKSDAFIRRKKAAMERELQH